jgi:hypothetical protein
VEHELLGRRCCWLEATEGTSTQSPNLSTGFREQDLSCSLARIRGRSAREGRCLGSSESAQPFFVRGTDCIVFEVIPWFQSNPCEALTQVIYRTPSSAHHPRVFLRLVVEQLEGSSNVPVEEAHPDGPHQSPCAPASKSKNLP